MLMNHTPYNKPKVLLTVKKLEPEMEGKLTLESEIEGKNRRRNLPKLMYFTTFVFTLYSILFLFVFNEITGSR